MSERSREKAEEGRVEAEADRVEAEGERVEAERGNGGTALEEGRVQAETGRIDAEEDRVSEEKRRKGAEGDVYRRVTTLYAMRFSLIFLVPTIVLLSLFWNEDRQSDQTEARLAQTIERLEQEVVARCVDARNNRSGIRDTILGSLAALGYRIDTDTGELLELEAGPIDYYATRPDEREAALNRTLKALRVTFPIITCPGAP